MPHSGALDQTVRRWGSTQIMNIRPAVAADYGALLDIWLRSVRATHTFLSEEDIRAFLPLVRDHALTELEVWVLFADEGTLMGFMGLSGNRLEALFLAPEFFRRGGGRRLVEHARKLEGTTVAGRQRAEPAGAGLLRVAGLRRRGAIARSTARGSPSPSSTKGEGVVSCLQELGSPKRLGVAQERGATGAMERAAEGRSQPSVWRSSSWC